MTSLTTGYFFDQTSWRSTTPPGNSLPKEAALLAELAPKDRANLVGNGYKIGFTSGLIESGGYFEQGWNNVASKVAKWTGGTKIETQAFAKELISNIFADAPNFLTPSEGPDVFWAQDLEANAALTDQTRGNASFAGIIAALWAGYQVLEQRVKIVPVVSSSIIKNLNTNNEELANLKAVEDMVAPLGINPLKPNPDGVSWNLMSLLKNSGLIDGFIYEQYGQTDASSTKALKMTSQNAPFDPTVELPYALIGTYYGTPQYPANLPPYYSQTSPRAKAAAGRNILFDYYDPKSILPIKSAAYFANYPEKKPPQGIDETKDKEISIPNYFSPIPQNLLAANADYYQYLENSSARIIDLTTLPTNYSSTIQVSLSREADYQSYSGFYKIYDSSGTIRDAVSGQLVRPGEPGYATIALSSANKVASVSNLHLSEDGDGLLTASVEGGFMMAPFTRITEPGKENTFFSFPNANRDGFAHFKQISSNSFGMEDMHGGGDQDFNDLVISFRFIDVIS